VTPLKDHALWKLALPMLAGICVIAALLFRRGISLEEARRSSKPEASDLPPIHGSAGSPTPDPTPYTPQAARLLERWNTARGGPPEALTRIEGELTAGNLALLLLKEPQSTLPLLEGVLSERRHSEVVHEAVLVAMQMHASEQLVQMAGRLLDTKTAVPSIRPRLLEATGQMLQSIGGSLGPAVAHAAATLHEKALMDPDPLVRSAALISTFRFPSPRSDEETLLDLFTRFSSDREAVVTGSLRTLLRVHAAPDHARLRAAVASALGATVDDQKASTALAILAELSPEESRPRVLAALEDPRPGLRSTAISLAGTGKLGGAIPILATMLAKSEGDRGTFEGAVQSLAQIGTDEAAAALAARLQKEPNSARRSLLATDLAEIPAIRNSEALGRAVAEALSREKDPTVQARLERALASNGTAAALERLQDRFTASADPAHQTSLAGLMLETSAGPEFASRQFSWLLGTSLAGTAVEMIAANRPHQLIPLVRGAYSPEMADKLSVRARIAMVRGLGALASTEARQELKRIQGFDADEEIRPVVEKELARRNDSP